MQFTKLTIRRILLLIMIAVISFEGFAQQTISGNENAKSGKNSYLTESFDLSMESLPSLFQGNDVVEIYKSLSDKLKGKGEFETTDEYNKRISEGISKPISGNLTKDSLFAFVASEIEKKYDADKQLLNVKAKLSDSWSIIAMSGIVAGGKGGYGIECKSSTKTEGTYSATNALGTKKEVEKFKSEKYYVVPTNYNKFSLKDEIIYKILSTDIKMDTQTAIKVKESLRVLLVGKIVKPYIDSGIQIIEPSYSSPIDGVIKNMAVKMEIAEIWYFDANSGKVFLKIKPSI